jgi:hypothetical protein
MRETSDFNKNSEMRNRETSSNKITNKFPVILIY